MENINNLIIYKIYDIDKILVIELREKLYIIYKIIHNELRLDLHNELSDIILWKK